MLDKLEKMTGGDRDRMKMLIQTYMEGITEYISLLSEAIESDNLLEIRKAVHISKPLFTIMGFTEVWNLANEIEESIDQREGIEFVLSRSKLLLGEMRKSLDSMENSKPSANK